MKAADLVRQAEGLSDDPAWTELRTFKESGGKVVGCTPAYVPTELIDAAGALPAHLWGVGATVEVIQGDAYFQSAICHLPRGLIELKLRGALDPMDLIVMPATCDVMRNLTGIWQLSWPELPVYYLDLPQRDDDLARQFYEKDLRELLHRIEKVVGHKVSDDDLRASIVRHNERRKVLAELEAARVAEPWRVPASDMLLLMRAGAKLTVGAHTTMLRNYLESRKQEKAPAADVARVLLTGAFCEAPPLGFLRTLERAGCAVLHDDIHLGMKWLTEPVAETGSPLAALADAYVSKGALAPCRYEGPRRRGEDIVQKVRDRKAQGVIIASPSFCDPALLDRPGLTQALEAAHIPCIQLQYTENSVDYGSVREQAGTFADALRLWEAA